MGWKGGSSPKKGTAQPCQQGVNVDHEKSLGNCLSDGINIYIMMAHNIKILFLLHEIFNDKYLWVTSYEFVERVIYLKGLFPHPNVSEFHLLSYLTPLYFPLQIH